MKWLDACRPISHIIETESHKLKDVARHLGIKFKHHDALEDARACGEILQIALSRSNTNIVDWFASDGYVISNSPHADGKLLGMIVVLDGYTIPPHVWQFLNTNKATVAKEVTYSTSILLVDHHDQETPKCIKATKYNSKTGAIRILTHREFIEEYY